MDNKKDAADIQQLIKESREFREQHQGLPSVLTPATKDETREEYRQRVKKEEEEEMKKKKTKS